MNLNQGMGKMRKGLNINVLFLIFIALLIFHNAEAIAGKIDPLLVALRAQQKDSAKVFIGSDGKEYISSPMPLSNLNMVPHATGGLE
jgi:hypothetical protein